MVKVSREVLERKLGFLRQFLVDLEIYARLDQDGRRKEQYAIERLLQLLCESAADIGIQMLKRNGTGMAGSYREVFSSLSLQGSLPRSMADSLIDACPHFP